MTKVKIVTDTVCDLRVPCPGCQGAGNGAIRILALPSTQDAEEGINISVMHSDPDCAKSAVSVAEAIAAVQDVLDRLKNAEINA